MSFAPGINGVAIFETQTPQTFTIDGQDVGTTSPEITAVTRQSGRGTLKKFAERFSWTIDHDNTGIHDALNGTDIANVQWQLVVWTFSGALFVLDKASFAPETTIQGDPESEDYPYQVRYEIVSDRITIGENLIAAYRRSQSQQVPANGSADVEVILPFPFPGATLTLSNGAPGITLAALDPSGAVLGSASTTTGSGRVSAELVLPAGSQSVRATIDDYQDAALRVDGKDIV